MSRENRGAIPLPQDVLSSSNVGLWVFELDEGAEPRMYVDDTMLGLLGLEKRVGPEETYHAWFDRVEPKSEELVTESVKKMIAGESMRRCSIRGVIRTVGG